MARGRPEIPKYMQKKVAKQLLERQKRAGVYEKGYTDLAKGSIAGSAYPVDIADMLVKPALTPPASYKAASLRPRGGGIPETVAPVQEPKLKGTYPYVARKMGIDPDSAESIAGSFFSLDPIAKAHAVAMGTKLVAGKLAGLGMGAAMFAGLKKVDDVADAAKPIFTSPGKTAASDISKETIPANKVKSQLEGRGVNKDEFEWTGFDDWIKTKKGEVPKAEVEEFFQQNQIQVQEVVKKEGNFEELREYNKFLSDMRQEYGTELTYEWPAEVQKKGLELERRADNPLSQPKFGNKAWQLPGGENYRELLLIAPPKKVPYTKENVIPISAEEYTKVAKYKSFNEADVYHFFDTPDGVQRVAKKQNKATDYLGDGFKGEFVFESPNQVDDFLAALSDEEYVNRIQGLGNLDYGRLSSNELVVQFDNLPNQDLDVVRVYAEQWGGKVRGLDEATDIKIPPPQAITQEEALQQVIDRQPEPKPRYTGGHFEENDVVAHIRFNERVDPDGNKVLFIEEIQGDWAHKGQSEGFYTKASKAVEKRMGAIGKRQVEIKDELQVPQTVTMRKLDPAESNIPDTVLGKEGQRKLDAVTAQITEWWKKVEWRKPKDQQMTIPEKWAWYHGDKRISEEFAEYEARQAAVPKAPKELTDKAEEIARTYDPKYEKDNKLIDEYNSLTKEYDEIKNKDVGYVPEGPFVTDTHQWTNLALKRMIRWGSDNGFDSIGWVTGKQSAKRYNVSQQISKIKYSSNGVLGAYDKQGKLVLNETNVTPEKLAEYIGKEPANKLLEQETILPSRLGDSSGQGIVTFEDPSEANRFTLALQNHLGDGHLSDAAVANLDFAHGAINDTQIADRGNVVDFLELPEQDLEMFSNYAAQYGGKVKTGVNRDGSILENTTYQTLEGIDLDIGGDYHKLIYDDVLLAQGKKIGKKYGAKVEEGNIGGTVQGLEVRKRGTMVEQIGEDGKPVGDWYLYDKDKEEIVDRMGDEVDTWITHYKTQDEAEKALDTMKRLGQTKKDAEGKVWTMRLTDKLKQASKDGMPYYVALPPIAIGAAAAEQRTDAQRLQSKSDAQAIMAN